ncbi:VOC family protein [Bacillus clarus]|uniref:Glyoxalase/Bleomycin resistance /Dioxygenase superfamily protein n=1 Tax=Bacillus clarus TaxID=2338372 RepID=A0A090YL42_9BACI|nr:VOC family protein [Bacillus clarus]KFM98612.1 glyoxalase/Bleomycin resistance /Dioxygenase superfamily protein [Bacillus clarus]RFT65533.1 VOC family protein [Bacillus clarus]
MLMFDHLVHVVHCTPEEAAKQMQKLGFHTVQGGEHSNWGTWNSLCYFDLSYIEFLAVQHEEKAKEADNPLVQETVVKLQDGEGMLQIAIRTEQIEELALKFEERGLQINGPFEGKRMRNDGRLLEWKMLFVKQEESGPKIPFFIQWNETDEERRNDLRKIGTITEHKNNVQEIETIHYAVKNVRETVREWKEIMGLTVSAVVRNEEWNVECQSVLFGNTNVQFCEPIGEGIVKEHLMQYGEYPFAVEFKGESKRKYEVLGSMYIY